jgi:hypothetical protein
VKWLSRLLAIFWETAAAAEKPLVDRPGPFYFGDLYWAEGDTPNFAESAKDPKWCGFILKATQGTLYSKAPWFIKNLPRAKAAGGARLGKDWFVGAYHYLNFHQRGLHQADYFLSVCKKAGVKWDDGTMICPVVDVERGKPGGSNYAASKALVMECVAEFAARVRAKTGRRVAMYGRGAMRDLGITSKMGCDWVWNPAYTKTMTTNGLIPPWSLDDINLWQYCGAGEGGVAVGYPTECPGLGRLDISKYIDGPRPTTLSALRRDLL